MSIAFTTVLAGCSTVFQTESGPDHTVASYVQVESSVPGVTVETNNVYAGKTPLTLKVFGNEDGTFHDFGHPEFVIRALPLSTNQFEQTQRFHVSSHAGPGDTIPGLIFFEMDRRTGGLSVDSIPDK
ncbi:MAG: hypothetical protein C5B50_19340 [Verrucomicrobia bacterium]|nr:MAG: hypothetical protein C5B50_19340 [Verrucomicrobiota bacterium]